MRKLFIDPTIEIKVFAIENIVTTSVTGQAYEGSIDDLRDDDQFTKAVINAGTVLSFND